MVRVKSSRFLTLNYSMPCSLLRGRNVFAPGSVCVCAFNLPHSSFTWAWSWVWTQHTICPKTFLFVVCCFLPACQLAIKAPSQPGCHSVGASQWLAVMHPVIDLHAHDWARQWMTITGKLSTVQPAAESNKLRTHCDRAQMRLQCFQQRGKTLGSVIISVWQTGLD